jgi:hypothetical protein
MQVVIIPVLWAACFIAAAVEVDHCPEEFLSFQRFLNKGD